jgi:hypothetical protein
MEKPYALTARRYRGKIRAYELNKKGLEV